MSTEKELIEHYAPDLVADQSGYEKAAKDIEEAKEEARAEICKLLQGQVKPKVTSGEIEEWLEEKWNEDWCDELYFNDILDWLIDLFKSKGFNVTDK